MTRRVNKIKGRFRPMIAKYLCGASCLSLLIAGGATAQPASQPSADATSADGIEEIVVTARRREERLQSVPIAISAVSGETLKVHQIANATDLGKLIPSVSTAQTNRDFEGYTIRGLSNSGVSGSGQSPIVNVYFDEVPYPTGDGGGPGRFFDLENIQVLKGPQGTLFGRNSAGGAVLYQPQKPTNNLEGYLSAQFGNHSDFEQEAAVNIPILEDKLLVRLAGSRIQRDGFTEDVVSGKDLDNRDAWSGRASITMRPTDDFQNDAVFDSVYSDTNGSSEVIGAINRGFVLTPIKLGPLGSIPLTIANGPLISGLFNPATQIATAIAGFKAGAFALFPPSQIDQILAQQAALGPRQVATDQPNPIEKYISQGFTDIARWDLTDNIAMRNIFGYRIYKQLVRTDIDGTPLPLVQRVTPNGWDINLAQYTEELQFQGKSFDNSLTWVVGAFGMFSHAGGLNQTDTIGFGTPSSGANSPTTRSEAVYAQGTYDLGHAWDALEGLKFTAGYRFTWDYRQLNSVQRGASGACQQPGANQNCDVSVESHGSEPSWTVGLDYQLAPDTLIYVTSRRGFRSGGLNAQAILPNLEAYGPEIVTDEEIGIKSDWELYGIKARTNLDLYNSDYTNKQASQPFATSVNGQVIVPTLVVNAGNLTIQGVEADITVVPVADLELTASWAYTQAHYDKYLIVATGQSVPGQTYPFTPQNKLSLSARYTLPVSADYGTVSIGALLAYQSHQYLGIAPTDPAYTTIGQGYTTIDLNLDWRNVFQSPIDLSLFATNVTNQVYKLGGYPIYGLVGFASYVYGEPQMYGAKIKYRFGGPSEPEAEPAAYVPPPVQAPAPKSYLVFFDFNKSDLTPEARDIVDTAARNAETAKVTELTVTGHTDTVGSDAYNMRLSRRRAESVAAELEKHDIPASEIEIVAKGKRDLLVPTKDGVREPQNRRVQIVYGQPAS
jgi:iron complex outermembrane receptor protein